MSLVAADDRLFVVHARGPHLLLRRGDLGRLGDGRRRRPPAAGAGAERRPAAMPFPPDWSWIPRGSPRGTPSSGSADGRSSTDLVRQTRLHLIAVDPNRDQVKAARDALIAADLYGERMRRPRRRAGLRSRCRRTSPRSMVAPAVGADALPAVYESLAALRRVPVRAAADARPRRFAERPPDAAEGRR